MKTTKREITKLATLWADASGLPQLVYKRAGEWRHAAAVMFDRQTGDQEVVTILPAYFFGVIDGRMAQATQALQAMGLR